LALNYYAKALSESFWMKKLDQQWKDYLSQPECQNSLLGGADVLSLNAFKEITCVPGMLIVLLLRSPPVF
jgi:hypothetical protein